MDWCNILIGNPPRNSPPNCYGYPDECTKCELARYLRRQESQDFFGQKKY